MPARYEAILRTQRGKYKSEKEAKKHAAMIYYGTRKKGEPLLHSGKKKNK